MKRFKYLYFTNIVNKPYFNFWILKKLKGGEEDDGNLFTQPENYTEGQVTWSWDKMTAIGNGRVSKTGTYMTDPYNPLPLKKNFEVDAYYTISIAEPLAKNLQCLFTTENGDINFAINAGQTSKTFQATADLMLTGKYKLRYMARGGDLLSDLTIKDIKMVKETS